MDRVHALPHLHERRERVFLVLAGLFLGCMTMLNIVGITRFVHIGPLALAVGVLPYPLTFLCTDFISEFYGRRRANFVVGVGFLLNVLVIAFLWFGHQLPGLSEAARPRWLPDGSWQPPPWQTLHFESPTQMPFGDTKSQADLFEMVYLCTRGSVVASMVAYLAAQFCDVFMFHFWKKLTRGKHLWLRNNGSTMISQLVDSIAVIMITFGAAWLAGERTLYALLVLVGSSYLFKVTVAALDTVPFYIGVRYLSRYLQIDPTLEPEAERKQ